MRVPLLSIILIAIVAISMGFKMSHLQPKIANIENIAGAWEMTSTSRELPEDIEEVREVRMMDKDGYFMFTLFSIQDKAFMGSGGGTYTLEGDQLTETIEFHTMDKDLVGSQQTYTVKWEGSALSLESNQPKKYPSSTYDRIDEGNETPLAAAWRITQRQNQEGEMTKMQMGPRKTIKLLTGTRFQWAAINTETKEFFGTGGGTYTLRDGKYTEYIEFFSRDASRIGMSLSFDAEVLENDWIHSGLSSKGAPIKEIWSKVK